jgi:NADP-reducing hydrogenase subunit HndC
VKTSLCGLGQAAPNPVISTITHFMGRIRRHIPREEMPAGVCKALVTYSVIPESALLRRVQARLVPFLYQRER